MSIRTSTDTAVYVKVPTSSYGIWEHNCGERISRGRIHENGTDGDIHAVWDIENAIQLWAGERSEMKSLKDVISF